jgi:maleate isomerase
MEFHKALPDGVSIHVSRCYLQEDKEAVNRVKSIEQMNEHLVEAARMVCSIEPNLIVWACTVGSFLGGSGYETLVTESIAKETGVPTITTSSAVVKAIHALQVKKLAIATPYIEEINLREKDYLEASVPDLKIVSMKGLGIVPNLPKGRLFPEHAYSLAKEVCLPSCDCVFISCTNWRTLEIISALERDLKRPVITSVQATIWLVFKIIGVSPSMAFGRLMESDLL